MRVIYVATAYLRQNFLVFITQFITFIFIAKPTAAADSISHFSHLPQEEEEAVGRVGE